MVHFLDPHLPRVLGAPYSSDICRKHNRLMNRTTVIPSNGFIPHHGLYQRESQIQFGKKELLVKMAEMCAFAFTVEGTLTYDFVPLQIPGSGSLLEGSDEILAQFVQSKMAYRAMPNYWDRAEFFYLVIKKSLSEESYLDMYKLLSELFRRHDYQGNPLNYDCAQIDDYVIPLYPSVFGLVCRPTDDMRTLQMAVTHYHAGIAKKSPFPGRVGYVGNSYCTKSDYEAITFVAFLSHLEGEVFYVKGYTANLSVLSILLKVIKKAVVLITDGSKFVKMFDGVSQILLSEYKSGLIINYRMIYNFQFKAPDAQLGEMTKYLDTVKTEYCRIDRKYMVPNRTYIIDFSTVNTVWMAPEGVNKFSSPTVLLYDMCKVLVMRLFIGSYYQLDVLSFFPKYKAVFSVLKYDKSSVKNDEVATINSNDYIAEMKSSNTDEIPKDNIISTQTLDDVRDKVKPTALTRPKLKSLVSAEVIPGVDKLRSREPDDRILSKSGMWDRGHEIESKRINEIKDSNRQLRDRSPFKDDDGRESRSRNRSPVGDGSRLLRNQENSFQTHPSRNNRPPDDRPSDERNGGDDYGYFSGEELEPAYDDFVDPGGR